MKTEYNFKQAEEALENGEIDGFSIGERVFAIKNTIIESEKDPSCIKEIPAKLHLKALKFSRGRYWFYLDNEWYFGRKSHFDTFPSGKFVIETWKA